MEMIECIPNISEGRRPELIAALGTALRQIPELQLLDIHSDPDHHRSVLTLIGTRAGLRQGMAYLCQWAIAFIDMRRHQGVHPRIGAVDVMPLVPLRGIAEAEAIRFSHQLAEYLAFEYHIPIYLYERSARTETRRHLPHLRRGQFEGLEAKMKEPGWEPDYGPHAPHLTCGAMVLGVRSPLVAFNVVLQTSDVRIARAIAATIRESGGGFTGLRAIGVYLAHQDRAQVSLNVLEPDTLFLYQILAKIRLEAALYGTAVLHCELVGLMPRAALGQMPPAYLQIPDWSEKKLLEYYLPEE